MGVWIETADKLSEQQCKQVTPCMGVWIETDGDYKSQIKARSHPVWVCGLKQL